MNSKVMALTIGATIAIILTGFVLMPVIDDAVDETRIYYNNAVGVYAEGAEDISIKFQDNTYYVNDNIVSPGSYVRLIMSDSLYVERSGTTCYVVAYANNLINRSTVSTLTVDVVDNVATVVLTATDNTYTFVIPVNWFYYADDSGEYRMVNVDSSNKHTVYFNNISDVTVVSRTTTDILSFHDEVPSSVGSTIDPVSVEYTLNEVSGVEGIYSLRFSPDESESDFNFLVGDTLTESSAVLVPFEVFGSKEGMGSASAVLNSIPVMIIVTVVVAIVAVIRSRD